MLAQVNRHLSEQGKPSAQDTGSTQGEDALAVLLSDLARSLEQEDDTEAMLKSVVQGAIALVPGVQAGSISVVTGRRHVNSQAASSDLPARVDELQEAVGEGPCLDAVYEHQTVRVENMATETRWPKFAAAAFAAGAGSMLSFQLYVEGDNLGALNLYSAEPGSFDDESEHVGLLFASHAAVALAGVQKHQQLTQGMATRDLIGQAKGRLMERYDINGERAFALLVRVSQTRNMKLREVAEELALTGKIATLGE
jgi:transcriptional regulator with GAF, ATPase, and Fis domain